MFYKLFGCFKFYCSSLILPFERYVNHLESVPFHKFLLNFRDDFNVNFIIFGILQALEFDREGLTKLKKAVKAIYNSGNSKLILWERIFYVVVLEIHSQGFFFIKCFSPKSHTMCIIITAHVDNEMCLVRALERLGSVALSKEEPDIGAAFLKFSVVTKELSALMKTLVSGFAYIHFQWSWQSYAWVIHTNQIANAYSVLSWPFSLIVFDIID